MAQLSDIARELSKAQIREANRLAITEELAKSGLPPLAIAALAGRIGEESGFDPAAHNSDDPGARGSIGIFQWNRGRITDLERFARESGGSASDIRTQARFLAFEILEGKERDSVGARRLLSATTPEEAAAGVIGLARPRGYTNKNPAGGLGWKGTLAATRKYGGEAEMFAAANLTLDEILQAGEAQAGEIPSDEGGQPGPQSAESESEAGGLGSMLAAAADAWLTGLQESETPDLESSSIERSQTAARNARPRNRSIAGFFNQLRSTGITGQVSRIT